MRKYAYYKMVLATFWIWVLLDMFLLLYFSECNKCDGKKKRENFLLGMFKKKWTEGKVIRLPVRTRTIAGSLFSIDRD
uniref:Uncharacterized protein n=1 Tax=Bos indicus x Bos taurus TaxID=30522 RepID=A0A4W2CXD7_BOBOX